MRREAASQGCSIDHLARTRRSHPRDLDLARINEKPKSTKDAVLDAIQNRFNRLGVGTLF
jgi:hypothetical protein